MHAGNKLSSLLEDDEPITRETVKIAPGETYIMGLGHYPKTHTEYFDWSVPPERDEEQMGVSFSRVDIEGKSKCMMVAMIHNYGSKPCDVTVWRVGVTSANKA